MLTLLSQIIRNQKFQDLAGITRGIVRIVDANNQKDSLFKNQINIEKQQESQQINRESKQQINNQQQSQTILNTTKEEINEINVDSIQLAPEIKLTENKIPETPFQRIMSFSSLGLNLTSNAIKQVVSSQFSQNKMSFKEALVSEENAKALAKGLCKMRGAPLKLAQALSIQEDEVIPKHIRLAFEQARQSADIMPLDQLEKVLIKELGSNWQDHFTEFNIKPFAAASIGQVHSAILKNGRNVALKIQYAGVKESIDSDLNNLKMLMEYTKIFPKTMFLDKLIENTRKELHEECDYLVEAKKQMKYRALFENQPEYIIPEVIDELTTQRILTAEYLYGDNLDYVADTYPQHLRNEIGRRIMSLTLQELFRFKTMQTDPNPSNFYFDRKQNKLILIDFGAVHEYSSKFIDNYITIIHGAAVNDRKVCLEKSVEIGFLTGEESIRMKEAHVDSIVTVGEPFRYQGEFDFGQQQMTKKIYELMPVMLKHRLRPPPQEIYSLHRKLSGAYLMNIRLQTKVNCRDIFMNLYEQYQQNQK